MIQRKPDTNDSTGPIVVAIVGFVFAALLFFGLIYLVREPWHMSVAVTGNPLVRIIDTQGPFEALTRDNGVTWAAGDPITSVRAGLRVAWINHMEFDAGVSVCGERDLVQVRTGRIVRTDKICDEHGSDEWSGSRVFTFLIPTMAPPGKYEIRRRVLARAEAGHTQVIPAPPISFVVTAPIELSQPAPPEEVTPTPSGP